jgi:hypothetical protein
VIDLDRIGRPLLVTAISCDTASALGVFAQTGGQFVGISALVAEHGWTVGPWWYTTNGLTITFFPESGGAGRSYR